METLYCIFPILSRLLFPYSEHLCLTALYLEANLGRVFSIDLALVDLGRRHRLGQAYDLLAALRCVDSDIILVRVEHVTRVHIDMAARECGNRSDNVTVEVLCTRIDRGVITHILDREGGLSAIAEVCNILGIGIVRRD